MLGGFLLLLSRHLHPQHRVGPRPRLLALQVVQQLQLVEPLDEGVLVPLVAEPHLLALLPELGLLQEAVDGLDGVLPGPGHGWPAAGRLQKGLAVGSRVWGRVRQACDGLNSLPGEVLRGHEYPAQAASLAPAGARLAPAGARLGRVETIGEVQGNRLAQLHQVATALAPAI